MPLPAHKNYCYDPVMTDQFHWIGTTGGPHILAPKELLPEWRGVEGWRDNGPDDDSDYARACAITEWLGKIRCGQGNVVVLSGDFGHTAWIPDMTDDSGVLVTWIGCDSEEAILAYLHGENLRSQNRSPNEEVLEFETGPSGVLTLFDSSEYGEKARSNRATFKLRPGHYRIVASSVQTAECIMVLRKVSRLSS